jgi:choline dehydrogenase-like flavoprotein
LIPSADVVVIGSGAFGASAAYHLARRGLRVAVLERSALASQTSPRAAGLSSQVRATPALTRLAQRAVAKFAAFTGETGQPLRFTQSGALKIARAERDAEQLAREVKPGRAAGVPIDFVSVGEARKRLPILGERGIVAVTAGDKPPPYGLAGRRKSSGPCCCRTLPPRGSRSARGGSKACGRRAGRSRRAWWWTPRARGRGSSLRG